MKKSVLSIGYFWVFAFAAIQMLAFCIINYWYLPVKILFGLPNWLWAFILVECLFSILFYLFIKNYWSLNENSAE